MSFLDTLKNNAEKFKLFLNSKKISNKKSNYQNYIVVGIHFMDRFSLSYKCALETQQKITKTC